MREILSFNSQPLLPRHFLSPNPIRQTTFTCPIIFYFTSMSTLRPPLLSLSRQTQIKRQIICASNSKRGSGSQKLKRILPHLVSFMVSNIKFLPEPWDIVIRELGAGSGGGSGFWKGFGGWRFDGWGRKGKRNFGFHAVLVITGLVLFLFGRGLKIELLNGILIGGLLGAFLSKGNIRRVKEFVWGVCFVAALMVLSLRREDMQKCVEKIRTCSPVMEIMRMKKKKSRRGRRFF